MNLRQRTSNTYYIINMSQTSFDPTGDSIHLHVPGGERSDIQVLSVHVNKPYFDVLVDCAEDYGLDSRRWDFLYRPSLRANNGFNQFIRLIVGGAVTPDDFEDVEATLPDEVDHTSYWPGEQALSHSELETVLDYDGDTSSVNRKNRLEETTKLAAFLEDFAREVAE